MPLTRHAKRLPLLVPWTLRELYPVAGLAGMITYLIVALWRA